MDLAFQRTSVRGYPGRNIRWCWVFEPPSVGRGSAINLRLLIQTGFFSIKHLFFTFMLFYK